MIRIVALLGLVVGLALTTETTTHLAKAQELTEGDALSRFEIDEFHLPRLNVLLPGLFKWSHADNAYLV